MGIEIPDIDWSKEIPVMPSKKLIPPVFIQDLTDEFAPSIIHENVEHIYNFLDSHFEWGSATSNTGTTLSRIKSTDYIVNITPLAEPGSATVTKATASFTYTTSATVAFNYLVIGSS